MRSPLSHPRASACICLHLRWTFLACFVACRTLPRFRPAAALEPEPHAPVPQSEMPSPLLASLQAGDSDHHPTDAAEPPVQGSRCHNPMHLYRPTWERIRGNTARCRACIKGQQNPMHLYGHHQRPIRGATTRCQAAISGRPHPPSADCPRPRTSLPRASVAAKHPMHLYGPIRRLGCSAISPYQASTSARRHHPSINSQPATQHIAPALQPRSKTSCTCTDPANRASATPRPHARRQSAPHPRRPPPAGRETFASPRNRGPREKTPCTCTAQPTPYLHHRGADAGPPQPIPTDSPLICLPWNLLAYPRATPTPPQSAEHLPWSQARAGSNKEESRCNRPRY
jgi:hypothetical protein